MWHVHYSSMFVVFVLACVQPCTCAATCLSQDCLVKETVNLDEAFFQSQRFNNV